MQWNSTLSATAPIRKCCWFMAFSAHGRYETKRQNIIRRNTLSLSLSWMDTHRTRRVNSYLFRRKRRVLRNGCFPRALTNWMFFAVFPWGAWRQSSGKTYVLKSEIWCWMVPADEGWWTDHPLHHRFLCRYCPQIRVSIQTRKSVLDNRKWIW